MEDGQIEVARIPEEMENPCPRLKVNGDDGESLMTNVKNYVTDFINTPLENHKICFKITVHNMVEKVETLRKSVPKLGGKSALVEGGEDGSAASEQSK